MTSTNQNNLRTLDQDIAVVEQPTRKRILARRWWYGLAGLGLVGLVAYGLRPQPIAVDLATLERGPLQVTVKAEGQTRVRDRFVVAAPVDGELQRIALKVGDPVAPGATLAQIDPLPLTTRVASTQAQLRATQAQLRAAQAQLDGVETQRPKPAALNQAETRIQAAQAAERQAQARVQEAQAAREQAQRERQRLENLYAQGAIARQTLESAQLAETQRQQELETARQQVAVAQADLQAARDGLTVLRAEQRDPDYLVEVYQAQIAGLEAELANLADDARRTTITAPTAGQVLQVMEPSARYVAAGTPLLALGNPGDLELVIDILSTDAVRVSPQDTVRVERWGGDQMLTATVRRVEPSAFTEVSALGVDEQRVNVIADFEDPNIPLGDGFRVEAQIVVWESPDVLKIPISALFRCDTDWCTFVHEAGRAQQRRLTLGPRSDFEAVVESGLAAGEQVVLYPGDKIEAGTRITGR
ncbi:MAG TPA: HlyD family efflux transporter periplasmic adaptor subunit [Leptolyngbyaceae cyanobacterium M65_K2018_010]|nr:HlyD family efflux transporter periplasmic adaptor subunit [Leptolyngbyaceae cyanobacterium M65_K2018_010]